MITETYAAPTRQRVNIVHGSSAGGYEFRQPACVQCSLRLACPVRRGKGSDKPGANNCRYCSMACDECFWQKAPDCEAG